MGRIGFLSILIFFSVSSCLSGNANKNLLLQYFSFNKVNISINYTNTSSFAVNYNSTASLNGTETLTNTINIPAGTTGNRVYTFKTDILENGDYAVKDDGCVNSGGVLTITGGTNNNGSGKISAASLTTVILTCSFPGPNVAVNTVNVTINYINNSTSAVTYNSTASLNGTETTTNSFNIAVGASGTATFAFSTILLSGGSYSVTDAGCANSGGRLTVTGGSNNNGTGVTNSNQINITISCKFPIASWFDTNSVCRKNISLTSTNSIPIGAYVTYTLDHASLVNNGKSLASGNDLRVVYGKTQTEISRSLKTGSTWNSATTKIVFQAQAAIAANAVDNDYFFYYCNPAATTPTVSVSDSPIPMTYNVGPYNEATTSWITKVSKTIMINSTSEVWLWYVTFALENSDTATNSATPYDLARVTINGFVDVSMGMQNNQASQNKMMIATGRLTGVSGARTIALQIRGPVGFSTTVKDVRIVALLMPNDADFKYSANDTLQALTAVGYTDIASPQLTVTPSSAGDYFVIASGQFGENGPGGNNPTLRFVNATDGVNYPTQNSFGTISEAANARSPFDTFFVIRKINFPSTSPKTFKFQFNNDGGVQGLRIFAFRKDAFELVESQEDLTESFTSSAFPVVKSTLTTATPSSYRDYLVIQSNYFYDNVGSTSHLKQADFYMDSTTLARQDHAIDKTWDYQLSSACVSTMNTNTSHTFQNRYGTNDASATYSKESAIHVFRLKDISTSAGIEETYP